MPGGSRDPTDSRGRLWHGPAALSSPFPVPIRGPFAPGWGLGRVERTSGQNPRQRTRILAPTRLLVRRPHRHTAPCARRPPSPPLLSGVVPPPAPFRRLVRARRVQTHGVGGPVPPQDGLLLRAGARGSRHRSCPAAGRAFFFLPSFFT